MDKPTINSLRNLSEAMNNTIKITDIHQELLRRHGNRLTFTEEDIKKLADGIANMAKITDDLLDRIVTINQRLSAVEQRSHD